MDRAKNEISRPYATDSVASKDGTVIGYRQLGSGSGIILVHGGMMASQNLMKLAKTLAEKFTVHVPDRRGRGLSGSQGNNYSLAKECEDLQALIHKTGTQQIFGLSAGAIITLRTALITAQIKKVALYEPPLSVSGTNPTAWVESYERAMAKGNLGAAMISIVRGTGDSSLLTFLPSSITVPLMNLAIKAEAKEVKGDDVPLKVLIATMHYDSRIVIESEGILDECENLRADVMLLGGKKSAAYLKVALDATSAALPQAKRIEFPGVGHLAAENGGKPELVARELRLFFA